MKAFAIFILLFSNNVFAAVDKYQLYRQISRYHHNVKYNTAKKYLFGKLFLDLVSDEYFVTDLYCQQTYGEEIGVGPMINASGTVINCEHSWPKDKFNPKQSRKLQESDLHHLFPVDAKANSYRGNLPFAEVDGDGIYQNCNSSKKGKPVDFPDGPTSFEPPDYHKGNVARAMFYFSIRYLISIDPIQEFYFRRWHQADPVDMYEQDQNNQIEQLQGNRNPFIDDPSLISNIDDF